MRKWMCERKTNGAFWVAIAVAVMTPQMVTDHHHLSRWWFGGVLVGMTVTVVVGLILRKRMCA